MTAEVTPHHLVLTDEDLKTYDTNMKVNPPLRSAEVSVDAAAGQTSDVAARILEALANPRVQNFLDSGS